MLAHFAHICKCHRKKEMKEGKDLVGKKIGK